MARGRAGVAATVLVVGGMLGSAGAELVPVQFAEGSAHGFLQVSDAAGRVIGGGDLVENTKGDQVTVRLVFRFKDGSVDDDRATYRQRGHFALVTERHIQRGPSFPHPVDLEVNVPTGMVTTRTMEAGHEEVKREHMDLPEDLANGMLLVMLKNVPASGPATTVSFLAATPKPRLIHLLITPSPAPGFRVGGVRHGAVQYTVRPVLGGFAGLVAPIVGMQPKDTQVWMSSGDVPAFGRLEGPTFLGGPQWTVEMAKPTWPARIGVKGTAADGAVVR